VDSLEVRSVQLYSFVAILFFIICFVGSRISLHYEEKSRKAKVL
jgi:ABC-type amino acid transport system permease subunit